MIYDNGNEIMMTIMGEVAEISHKEFSKALISTPKY